MRDTTLAFKVVLLYVTDFCLPYIWQAFFSSITLSRLATGTGEYVVLLSNTYHHVNILCLFMIHVATLLLM